MARKTTEYINNAEFTKCVSDWVEGRKTNPSLKMPDYLGECFNKLATRYLNKPNFSGYSYKDEMKSEAILHCVKGAINFNPEKSSNAFAYFTQVIHNAAIMMINKEKSLANFKFEMVREGMANSDRYNYKSSDSEE